jgi:cellulose synthase/poly-beta-1,6-N-acetylglucosamine synthase-like glycosyltransferase
MVVVLALFVFSSAVLVWAFAGYPLILYLLGKLRPNPVSRHPYFPQVTVLISSYQEAKVIQRRLDNLLESDYALENLEILVVDSASPDGTADLVEEYCRTHPHAPIRLIREDARRGKVSAINLGLAQAQGEIVVLTDAPALFWTDTLRLIVENFYDPQVGAATGKWIHYPYDTETPAQKSRRSVVGFRTLLRHLESQVDSTYAVTGELLAFRKRLIPSIPSEIGQDDLYIALTVRQQGYRVIADPRAAYTEKSARTYSDLIAQKKKESAGCTQLVIRFRRMIFDHRYGLYGLLILPTKIIHSPLNPLFLGLALMSGAILVIGWLGILTSLFLALGLALCGGLLWLYHRGRLFNALTGFLLSEWILFRGLVMYLRGEYSGVWETVSSTRDD